MQTTPDRRKNRKSSGRYVLFLVVSAVASLERQAMIPTQRQVVASLLRYTSAYCRILLRKAVDNDFLAVSGSGWHKAYTVTEAGHALIEALAAPVFSFATRAGRPLRIVLEAVDQLEAEGTPATATQVALDVPNYTLAHVQDLLTEAVRHGLLHPPSVGSHGGYSLTMAGKGALREVPH